MQQSNAPSKFILPFADAGAKNTIPVDSQVGITPGAASLEDGFPPLTRTPIVGGGVPPSGLDMNGILFELSAISRWANAGASYPYDAAFAADPDVGGYPKGAVVLRTDGAGGWLSLIENNATDPEANTTNWTPYFQSGVTAITMTSANVTLTANQAGLPIIVITGALTTNLNLVLPVYKKQWSIANNTTGAFTITAKTAAGTGVVIPQGQTSLVYGDGTGIKGASAAYATLLANAFTGIQSIDVNSASPALRVTQRGTGDVVRFEDSTNPDSTPFVIDANGNVGIGTLTPLNNLHLIGAMSIERPSYPVISIQQTGSVGRGQIAMNGNDLELRQLDAYAISFFTSGVKKSQLDANGNFIKTINASAAALTFNNNTVDELTSNTKITTKVRGTDGTTRSIAKTNLIEAADDPTFANDSERTPSTSWVQGLVDTVGIGVGQTWQNLIGSRAAGVTYTNTSGRPIQITLNATMTGGTEFVGVVVNGVTVRGAQSDNTAGNASYISLIIPIGVTYQIVAVVGAIVAIQSWFELR